jgi:hypothetical protein
MKIKLHDYGCFFIKVKDNDEIYIALYIKTNYMMKHKKKMVPKQFLVPNKLYTVIFDQHGADFIAAEPVPPADFEKMLIEGSKEFYDFKEYKNAEELYNKMKASGLKKRYNKSI